MLNATSDICLQGRTILLVDDDDDALAVLSARCKSVGMHVHTARNLLTALSKIEQERPDIICADIEMPTGNGLEFCEMLAADGTTANIPRIVITGSNCAAAMRRARGLCASVVPKGPAVWAELQVALKQVLADEGQSIKPASGKTVVIADNDRATIDALGARLKELGCHVIAAETALEAINEVDRILPDLVCLDVGMPSGSGLSVCEMMAADPRLQSIPTIVLTGKTDPATIRRCQEMTAYYVAKSADLWKRVEPVVCEAFGISSGSPNSSQTGARDVDAEATSPPSALAQADENSDEGSGESSLLDAVFDLLGHDVNDGNAPAQADDAPPWVLSIDDDVDFSDALKCRLEAHGVAVVRAFDGTAGYRMAISHPCSAILLDYQMPNGQGDYVLRRLKESPVTSEIPVIMITGVKDRSVERKVRGLGAAAYLEKPVRFEELQRELARYIHILSFSDEATILG